MKIQWSFLGSILGVFFGAVCIFGAGALIMPLFVLVLFLRFIGLAFLGERLSDWFGKTTTRFTF